MRAPTANQQIDQMRRLKAAAAAALIGVSRRSLVDMADAPRNEDGTYDGVALFEWALRKKTSITGTVTTADPAGDRYRVAKAELVEMELRARRGELVPFYELEEWFRESIAVPLLRAADQLKIRFGDAAAAMVTAVLEQVDQVIEERAPEDDE